MLAKDNINELDSTINNVSDPHSHICGGDSVQHTKGDGVSKENEAFKEEEAVGSTSIASPIPIPPVKEEDVDCATTNPVRDECECATDIAEAGGEVALECNAESLPYSYTVQFIELPDLVTEEILKHLETPDKLSLRLTCRKTKQWVETSRLLSLFQVSIPSNHEMNELVQFSKVFTLTKWRCVSLPEKSFTNYVTFPAFVSTFSYHISTLHMRNFDAGLAQILFVSSCEALEHLKIDEMDLRQNPSLVIASDKTLRANCPKLLDIFTELKSLLIGIIFFNDVKHLPFYQTFLQRCRKLEKVNVPRTQGPSTISWESLKKIQLRSIIGPISEYLRKKPVTSPIKTDIQVLDVDGLFSRYFPVVAETIVQIGAPTLFENVNEKHVKYLFTHEGDILQRILTLKEKIDDRRPISKWIRLQRLYVRSSRCDVRNEYVDFKSYPSLKFLTIVMDSRSREDPNLQMLQRFVKLLIFSEREALKEFTLQWPSFSHDTPHDYIRAQDFVGNFCNLTKLHVSGWTVPDDDYLLVFNVLGKLKVLILVECQNLTDAGVLGSADLNEPAIMNLKYLNHLEIRNRCNRGLLSDECFSQAFMHMRLTHFLIESFHVTLDGYKCLIEGEFKSTIRKLPVPQVLPRGISTEDDFIAFVAAHFPSIIL